MSLHPEYMTGLPDELVEIYSMLETKILQDIARRLKATGSINSAIEWQIYKLQEMGMHNQYIQEELAKITGVSAAVLARLFKEAGIESLKTDKALMDEMIKRGLIKPGAIPLDAAPGFAQVMNANLKRTQGTLKYLTGSTVTDSNGMLNKYMDQAQMMWQSGAFTQQEAIDEAIKNLADENVTMFDYISGATITMEAGVRRAVVTGVSQAIAEISLSNAAELGADLVEVTQHRNARPAHAKWQGKIFSISGAHAKYESLASGTGYGTGPGLCGWNCRHSFHPFVEGISNEIPRDSYDPALYEAEQVQRKNERKIREWKKKASVLEAGGVDNTFAKGKVKYWSDIQRKHIKENGLPRRPDLER